MSGNITFDKEKVTFNLAKLKKGGQNFEIVVDPDLAIDFKQGKEVDIEDVLKYEKIFEDAKKGELAPEIETQKILDTIDPLKVAKIILEEGEIQLTAEHRQKLRDEKRNKIISIIVGNGIDPRTKLPHPRVRIENAFEIAKISIAEMVKAEDQVENIIRKLQPILPISFKKKRIAIKVPGTYAGKAYSVLQNSAKLEKEEWLNDGSFACVIEIGAGFAIDLFDKLNGMTHGEVESKELDE